MIPTILVSGAVTLVWLWVLAYLRVRKATPPKNEPDLGFDPAWGNTVSDDTRAYLEQDFFAYVREGELK